MDAKSSSETSIWQMTVSERKNAALFIQYTTVRPFIFMGSSFKCFYCHTNYSYDLKSLLEHTQSHEVRDCHVILEKYVTKNKRALQVDISILKCRLCDESFVNLDSIREHLTSRHGKDFLSASNGMTEYKMEIVNNMFICHICDREFHNFNLINAHMHNHISKVVCENCGSGFPNQRLLIKHKEMIHLVKKFECQYCKKYFFKRTQLKYHTEIVHKGRERVKLKKCPQCSNTFKEHYSKVKHLRDVHGITKTFPCHICRNTFSTRRALTEHTNRYHTEKYKCETCSRCFAIESKLKQHMRGHTGVKDFICPICKNAYMHKVTLKKHMDSHNSVSKFDCNKCGNRLQSRIEFVEHMNQWHPPD